MPAFTIVDTGEVFEIDGATLRRWNDLVDEYDLKHNYPELSLYAFYYFLNHPIAGMPIEDIFKNLFSVKISEKDRKSTLSKIKGYRSKDLLGFKLLCSVILFDYIGAEKNKSLSEVYTDLCNSLLVQKPSDFKQQEIVAQQLLRWCIVNKNILYKSDILYRGYKLHEPVTIKKTQDNKNENQTSIISNTIGLLKYIVPTYLFKYLPHAFAVPLDPNIQNLYDSLENNNFHRFEFNKLWRIVGRVSENSLKNAKILAHMTLYAANKLRAGAGVLLESKFVEALEQANTPQEILELFQTQTCPLEYEKIFGGEINSQEIIQKSEAIAQAYENDAKKLKDKDKNPRKDFDRDWDSERKEMIESPCKDQIRLSTPCISTTPESLPAITNSTEPVAAATMPVWAIGLLAGGAAAGLGLLGLGWLIYKCCHRKETIPEDATRLEISEPTPVLIDTWYKLRPDDPQKLLQQQQQKQPDNSDDDNAGDSDLLLHPEETIAVSDEQQAPKKTNEHITAQGELPKSKPEKMPRQYVPHNDPRLKEKLRKWENLVKQAEPTAKNSLNADSNYHQPNKQDPTTVFGVSVGPGAQLSTGLGQGKAITPGYHSELVNPNSPTGGRIVSERKHRNQGGVLSTTKQDYVSAKSNNSMWEKRQKAAAAASNSSSADSTSVCNAGT